MISKFLLLISCLKSFNWSLSTWPQDDKDPIFFTFAQEPRMVFAVIKDRFGDLWMRKVSRTFHDPQLTRELIKLSSRGWHRSSSEKVVILWAKWSKYFNITRWTGDVKIHFNSRSLKNGDFLWDVVCKLQSSLILFLCSASTIKWQQEIINEVSCGQASPIIMRLFKFISSQSINSSFVRRLPDSWRAENTEWL